MKLVTKAKYDSDFKLKVTFNDGQNFKIDFKELLNGPIYEPLKNIKEFKKFFIHPELEVLSWPNGADFSSDFLYKTGKKQSKISA